MFIARNPGIIEFLPRSILPQRLETIRFLTFKWEFRGPPPISFDKLPASYSTRGHRLRQEMWSSIWWNLSELKGLEVLRVQLIFHHRDWHKMTPEELTAILEPLLAIKTSRVFELSLLNGLQPNSNLWDALPCRVTRSVL